MSQCDTCRKPGSCCRGFVLNRFYAKERWQEMAQNDMERANIPYFKPVRARPALDDESRVFVYFDCQRLGNDGRCTQYDDRPQTCRTYEAGSDPLCVEFVQRLRGTPIVVECASQVSSAK